MRNSIIIWFIFGTVLLAGCGKKHDVSGGTVKPWSALDKLVSESPVIIFASVFTNNPGRIQLGDLEIWKGSQESLALGITNGMLLPLDCPTFHVEAGLKAIAFLPKQSKPILGMHYNIGSIFVRAGRFGRESSYMTIQDFKTRYGL